MKQNEFFIWEEKNSTEPKKNFENRNELETQGTTQNTETKLKEKECENIGNKKELTKSCHKCGNKQTYSTKSSYNKSVKCNSVCKECHRNLLSISGHSKKINGPYVKKCPKCNKTQEYSLLMYLNEALRNKALCRSCTAKLRIISDESKKRMSKSGKGKIFSEKHKQNLSKSLLGENGYFYGKKLPEETKRKIRVSILKRIEKLGIGTKEDKGAREWFEKYNKENNTNYKPRRFLDLGYDADGYDEKLHSWIEYDTPYHKSLYQQKEDLIRQNNIIKYYESIGTPLNKFIRVITWKNNEIKEVYKYDK
jgi:hypothetical protein